MKYEIREPRPASTFWDSIRLNKICLNLGMLLLALISVVGKLCAQATIPLGNSGAQSLAFDPGTHFLYASQQGPGSVRLNVINTLTNTVTGSINHSAGYASQTSVSGSTVFVPDQSNSAVRVFSVSGLGIPTLSRNDNATLATGTAALASNYAVTKQGTGDYLEIRAVSTGAVQFNTLIGGSAGAVYSDSNTNRYYADYASGAKVVDAGTGAVVNSLTKQVLAVDSSAAHNFVYVANSSTVLAQLSGSANTQTATYDFAANFGPVAVNPANGNVLVAVNTQNKVVELSSAMVFVRQFTVTSPQSIIVADNQLYVGSSGASSLSVIQLGLSYSSIALGNSGAQSLAFDPATHFLYASQQGPGSVRLNVINTLTNTVAGSINHSAGYASQTSVSGSTVFVPDQSNSAVRVFSVNGSGVPTLLRSDSATLATGTAALASNYAVTKQGTGDYLDIHAVSTGAIQFTTFIGGSAGAVYSDANTNRYYADYASGAKVVDAGTGALVRSLSTQVLAVDSGATHNFVYVANSGTVLAQLSGNLNTQTATYDFGVAFGPVTVNPANGNVLVAVNTQNKVVELSSSMVFVRQFTVTSPQSIIVADNQLYVGSSGASSLSVIQLGISISTSPTSQSVAVGAAVNLTVTAAGGTSYTYQWYLNGQPISGATAATYPIASAQPGHSGSYTVVVGSGAETVTSAAAILTVYSPVALGNSGSQSLAFDPGTHFLYASQQGPGSVRLNVINTLTNTVTGSINHSAGYASQTSVSGSTVFVPDQSNSQVRVFLVNGAGVPSLSRSDNATLATGTAALASNYAVTKQGTGDYLEIRAVSTGVVQFNTLVGGSAGAVYSDSNTNRYYADYASGAKVVDAGTGAVVNSLTKQVLAVDSSAAHNFVYVANSSTVLAQLTGSANTQTATYDFAANFGPVAVNPANGNVFVAVNAQNKVVELSSNLLFVRQFTVTSPQSILVADNQLYVGSSGASSLSVIQLGLSISISPSSQSVAVAAAVNLTVTAAGGTSYTYQWYLNGQPISGATAATYPIASAQPGHSGSYTVVVGSGVDTVTSAAAILTVYSPVALGNSGSQSLAFDPVTHFLYASQQGPGSVRLNVINTLTNTVTGSINHSAGYASQTSVSGSTVFVPDQSNSAVRVFSVNGAGVPSLSRSDNATLATGTAALASNYAVTKQGTGDYLEIRAVSNGAVQFNTLIGGSAGAVYSDSNTNRYYADYASGAKVVDAGTGAVVNSLTKQVLAVDSSAAHNFVYVANSSTVLAQLSGSANTQTATYDFAANFGPVAVNPANGNVFVAVNAQNKVVELSSNLLFVRQFTVTSPQSILVADNQLYVGSSGASSLSVIQLGTASESWRMHYFASAANSGNGADTATPDNDGITNLMKYALVIVPGFSGAQLLPAAQTANYVEGSRLFISFKRDPGRNDITIRVKGSNSPAGPWIELGSSVNGSTFTGTGFVSETNAGGGLKTVEVRDTINIADAPHRFMRVEVTR